MMQTKVFPTLYKVNSRGKTQEWSIVARNHSCGPEYVVTYGQVGGSMQTTTVSVPCGKNLGKANETSAWDQACLEAESKWKKQLDKGYRTALPIAQCPQSFLTSDPIKYLPMLAKSYADYSHKIVFPCFGQYKLDGLRCIAYKRDGRIILLSRRGKTYKAVDHIKDALEPLFAQYPDIILDGELFTTQANFQTIISAIKRDTPSSDSHMIEYWVYDHFSDDDFEKRTQFVQKATANLEDKIRAVDTFTIKDESDVTAYHKKATSDGFEGIMLRNVKGEYQRDKRSDNLQKVKEFLDAEFVIVDAEENKGKQAGQCTFICVTDDGKRFGVKPMGDDFQRSEYWTNRHNYIGKELTVRFFEYSNDGIPRFPVGVAIRDYE